MAESHVKSPEHIKREYLVKNSGYIILHLLLLIPKIILVIIVMLVYFFQLPAVYAVVWPWLCFPSLSSVL